MLCRTEERLPSGAGWVYEPKFDGFRVTVVKVRGTVTLRGRGGGALEKNFADIIAAIAVELPDDSIVDGEIIVVDAGGASFDALLDRLSGNRGTHRPAVMAFDVLRLDGRDLTGVPLRDRRAELETLLANTTTLVLTPQTDDVNVATAWIDGFADQGIEGVVAKRASQRYLPGRRDWVKVKARRTVECVVGGYRGDGVPETLMLGLHTDDGLRFVGHTVPLPAHERARAASFLELADDSPFERGRPGASRWEGFRFDDHEWVRVKPTTVVEVAFTQLSYGMFRHATRFLRWRPDREPRSCDETQLPDR
jgi:ATP-dependent DNA ligase